MHGIGLCCRPGQVEKNYAALRECERAGYLRFLTIEQPWITDAGRRAIGAPSQAEYDRARVVEAFCKPKSPLQPAKRKDPRTDFDYRSYRACGYVCTLVMKQVDGRINPLTVRVGKSLKSDPQFLGPNNSIVQPESEGRFLLTVMPAWLPKRAGFPTYPLPLDETDPEFSDAERETWERLRNVCQTINVRIRTAGRQQRERLPFGATA